MKIGLNMQITDTTPHPMEIARKCEALGFESMFVNEHMVVPVNPKTPYYFGRPGEAIPEYYAHFPEPFIALAMAAAVTKTIKLGTCVSLVAEHEPIALAKAIATLDFFIRWPVCVRRRRRMAARRGRGDGCGVPPPMADGGRVSAGDEGVVDPARGRLQGRVRQLHPGAMLSQADAKAASADSYRGWQS